MVWFRSVSRFRRRRNRNQGRTPNLQNAETEPATENRINRRSGAVRFGLRFAVKKCPGWVTPWKFSPQQNTQGQKVVPKKKEWQKVGSEFQCARIFAIHDTCLNGNIHSFSWLGLRLFSMEDTDIPVPIIATTTLHSNSPTWWADRQMVLDRFSSSHQSSQLILGLGLFLPVSTCHYIVPACRPAGDSWNPFPAARGSWRENGWSCMLLANEIVCSYTLATELTMMYRCPHFGAPLNFACLACV
jgi:hypothetical protein